MSQKKSNTYEIHTSMKTELILEELKAMKRKFLPVGELTSDRFSLLVLPPAHRSGRKRTGGFVQLLGSISEQDGKRCIHIKTCSGAGFIIPMAMAVLFLWAIGMAILAGNWSVQLLFPICFLIIFYAVLLYMRKNDAIKAEEILREHFEGTDHATEFRYTTRYSQEQCMEFMKHDNMNDIYVYEWRQEKTFGALVIKDYKKPDRVHDFDGRQEWGLIVRFCEQPGSEETLVEATHVQTEKLPYVHNKEKIDIFWKEKLDACVL